MQNEKFVYLQIIFNSGVLSLSLSKSGSFSVIENTTNSAEKSHSQHFGNQRCEENAFRPWVFCTTLPSRWISNFGFQPQKRFLVPAANRVNTVYLNESFSQILWKFLRCARQTSSPAFPARTLFTRARQIAKLSPRPAVICRQIFRDFFWLMRALSYSSPKLETLNN